MKTHPPSGRRTRREERNGYPPVAPQRFLVTGGAGFIGSHLCEQLLGDGHQVVCVDDFSTGSPLNVAQLLDHPNFHLLEHDVTEPLPRIEADRIFNLACPASPVHYQRDPVQTTRTNILGALNTLELARALGVPVLQASTSEVYGDPDVHPQKESYWGNVNPIGRRSCYDEGKRCAESIFFDYHRQYGIEIKLCRIFNTYGPNMHPADGRVVSNCLVQALQNQPITIYGEGSQTRSFCYVEDMVDALVRLMFSPPDFRGPVNLGNPEEYTILELVRLVCEITASTSRVIFQPLPEDDPRQRRPDITLAGQVLGWRPKICLREGLQLTAAYFEELLQRTPAERKTSRAGLNHENPSLTGQAGPPGQ